MNLISVHQQFATEDEALNYLVKNRWPDGVRCIACDHDKVYPISTKGKTGKPCRLFECGKCGLHFSATTGTLFHDSHLPLQKWFMAMALMCEAKKGHLGPSGIPASRSPVQNCVVSVSPHP